MTERICGVDVSSSFLDAQVGREGLYRRFSNTAEGHAGLMAFCQEQEVDLVAMEATGGYERPLLAALAAAGVAASVLNPREVRRFAEAMGRLEKTDRIDAGMIAWFAGVRGARPVVAPSAAQAELRAMVTRVGQLTRRGVAERHQARLVSSAMLRSMSEQLIGLIEQQISELTAAIARLLAADPLWRALDRACREIKGVGERTVALLMAELPELGTLTGKQIGKLTGLAPMAQDSGTRQGRRSVRGGRRSLRALLYIIAWGVARYEPDFKAFRDRLKAKGKPARAVYVAIARKLLVRLNAKARDARKELNAAEEGERRETALSFSAFSTPKA